MENVARVVLALEHHDVAEEVMHFLDRSGRARVVATAGDDRQLAEAVRQLEPDAVVAQPLLVDSETVRGRPLLAVDTRESVAGLRAAIRAGARGFFLWPGDRDELAGAAAATIAAPVTLDRRALVVAVHGARGGVGTTFVATHLARAFARLGSATILIDADPVFGDVGAALGAPAEDVRTIGDLLPLVTELSPRHLDEALWTHDEGFRVLLAPPPEEASAVSNTDLDAVMRVAAAHADVVVLHLARTLSDLTRAAMSGANRVVEVLSLDVLSFRAARRALEALGPLGLDGRAGFVVNRAARAEIAPRDVDRVFGRSPLAVIPSDRGVERAQDHGRLLPARGRMGRAFDRLARRLQEEDL